jgi:hypothetical protein
MASAPIYELSLEGDHHSIKVGFGGEVESDSNSWVSYSLALRDPLQSHLLTLVPFFPFPTSPYCGRFVPVDFFP